MSNTIRNIEEEQKQKRQILGMLPNILSKAKQQPDEVFALSPEVSMPLLIQNKGLTDQLKNLGLTSIRPEDIKSFQNKLQTEYDKYSETPSHVASIIGSVLGGLGGGLLGGSTLIPDADATSNFHGKGRLIGALGGSALGNIVGRMIGKRNAPELVDLVTDDASRMYNQTGRWPWENQKDYI